MKLAVFADDHCFRIVAIFVEKCSIVGCAVSRLRSFLRTEHAMTVGHKMRRPGEGIASLVVVNHARNGAFAVDVSLYAFGNPARRGRAISGKEGHKRSARLLNSDISGRADAHRLGELNENNILEMLA